MRTVNISNRGNDKNDGAIDKPMYSWKRAKEGQGGNDNITVRFLDKASAVGCISMSASGPKADIRNRCVNVR
jgi:hypothetical protein